MKRRIWFTVAITAVLLLMLLICKGSSIERYSAEEIMAFAHELNSRPRKRLGYTSPEDIFESSLDSIYDVQ